MTREEYKELQKRFCRATEILNDIDRAKREIKLYATHRIEILSCSNIQDLKLLIPEDKVDETIEDLRSKTIRNLKASIANLEREFEEL